MAKFKVVDRIRPFVLDPQGRAYLATIEWEDDSQGTKDIKARLVDHLLREQMFTCSYCKLPVDPYPGSGVSFDIEHFIEKGSKPVLKAKSNGNAPPPKSTSKKSTRPKPINGRQWQFEPYNLSISCRDCNRKKRWGRGHILSQQGKQKAVGGHFPSASADYGLIHPYFDTYSDFLEIHTGWIYRKAKPHLYDKKAEAHLDVFRLKTIAKTERSNRIAQFLQKKGKFGRYVLAATFASDRRVAVRDLLHEMRAAAILSKDTKKKLDDVAESLPPIK